MGKKKGQILSDLNKRGVKGKKETQNKRMVKDQRVIDFIDLVDCDEKWIKKEEEFILPNAEDEENVLLEAINKSNSLKKKRVKKGDKSLRYKCSKCSKSYANKCHLNRHMNSHNPKYKCKLCKKVYVRINDHRTHMKMHKNGGVKPFKCLICDKGFTRKENLNTHLQLHSSGKRFDCSTCGKKFSSKMNRDVHMSTHAPNRPKHKSERVVECHHCGMTSTRLSGIRFHMKVHMMGYKPKESKKRKKASVRTVKEVKTEK